MRRKLWVFAISLLFAIVMMAKFEVDALANDKQPKSEKKSKAQGEALEAFCDMAAERAQDLGDLHREQNDECGQSSGDPETMAAFVACGNHYYNKTMQMESRYEARMSRLREKAEKQIKRAITDTDCCDALPSRFKTMYGRCMAYR